MAWFPKAFTSGCTIECKSLAANGDKIRKFGVAATLAGKNSRAGTHSHCRPNDCALGTLRWQRHPRFGAYQPMPTRYPANPPSAAKTPTPTTFKPGLYRTHDSSLTGQNNLLFPAVAATAPTVAPATTPTSTECLKNQLRDCGVGFTGCVRSAAAGEPARFGRRPLDARVHRLAESSQFGRPRCPLDDVRERLRGLSRRTCSRRKETEQANQDPLRFHSHLLHIHGRRTFTHFI